MSTGSKLRIILATWLFLAITASEAGLLTLLPAPGLQVLLFGLTLAVLAIYRGWSSLFEWVGSISVRWLIAPHLVRLIGIYFLSLYERGELPHDFAVYGGWGDICVAALALVMLVLPLSRPFPKLLMVWNLVGLADIMYVVLLAAKHNLEKPASMIAMTYLPLSLLPTFIVPLIISTHLFILIRLSRARGDFTRLGQQN